MPDYSPRNYSDMQRPLEWHYGRLVEGPEAQETILDGGEAADAARDRALDRDRTARGMDHAGP